MITGKDLYSKYNTYAPIEPELEQFAHNIINGLGEWHILEGAQKIGDNYCRIWYRKMGYDLISWMTCPIEEKSILDKYNEISDKVTKTETIKEEPLIIDTTNSEYFIFY